VVQHYCMKHSFLVDVVNMPKKIRLETESRGPEGQVPALTDAVPSDRATEIPEV
jgi:hypothetical protein